MNTTDLTLQDKPSLETAALLTIKPDTFVKEVFSPFKADLRKAIKAASTVPAYDITTTAGMDVAKKLRASFRVIRTSAENLRKERKAPIMEIGKLLDSKYKELEAEIRPLEDKYDAEIKAEEDRKERIKQEQIAQERARIEAIENRLAKLRSIPSRHLQSNSESIIKEIDAQSTLVIDPKDYDEFYEDAIAAINASLVELERMRKLAEEREAEARRVEAERAELARLKAEKEEAERKQHEEKQALLRQLADETRQREEAERKRQQEDAARQAEADAKAKEQEQLIAELTAKLAAAQAIKVPMEDVAPAAINSTGQYYSTTTFRDDGEPILLNSDGTRSIFCDVDEETVAAPESQEVPKFLTETEQISVDAPAFRPTDDELVAVAVNAVAEHYAVSPQQASAWLSTVVFTF